MSEPSVVAAIQNEKVSAAHEWIEQNDEHTNGSEKKPNESFSQAYPTRTIVIDRKAKRKDDRPLELICGWIVEHQIGTMRPHVHNCKHWLMQLQDSLSTSSCYFSSHIYPFPALDDTPASSSSSLIITQTLASTVQAGTMLGWFFTGLLCSRDFVPLSWTIF